jgi:hypothetical protein
MPIWAGEVVLNALKKDRDLRCQTTAELRADMKRPNLWFAKTASA